MASCKEETIKVRGRSTRLFRAGDGPPLMFLHDEFCPSWLPLHDKLAAEFEVFVPLHPGFSASQDHFDQFEVMEDLVIHYLDLCEALGLERPTVAGASFGGCIAARWVVGAAGSGEAGLEGRRTSMLSAISTVGQLADLEVSEECAKRMEAILCK